MNAAHLDFVSTEAADVSSLYRLIYRSEAVVKADFASPDAVRVLTATSAQRNAANGITGALVYQSGQFLQVLEGSRITLELTFERICRDRRHRGLALLEFAPVDYRRFKQWAMAMASHDSIDGSEVINLALGGIASEGGSQMLINAIVKTFEDSL